MKLRFSKLPLPAKVAFGAVAGFAVGSAAVILTAAAAGFHLTPTSAQAARPPSSASTPAPQQSPQPAPAGVQGGAQKAIAMSVLQAEAQALGMQPRDLEKDLKQGTTVGQLAAAKGISQDAFRGLLIADLTPLLDQQVGSQQLTSEQEHAYLKKLQTAPLPNWSQAGHAA